MDRLIATLQRGWWSIGLYGYRDCRGTYALFPYEGLPPIHQDLDEAFRWLEAEPLYENVTTVKVEDVDLKVLDQIVTLPDLRLPSTFTLFVRSPSLQKRIRSATGCHVDLLQPIPIGEQERGYLLHFFSDHQGCLHWYLYVNAEGDHCVLVSGYVYGYDKGTNRWICRVNEEEWAYPSFFELLQEKKEIWYCAPSFSEYLYRYWLENAIAFDYPNSLTPVQLAYLEHYQSEKTTTEVT
ncbi:MAG TPA: hypothetical protein VKU00_06535 [Chthonomonadaceae bacterium]|nr:hypothetical protein [Chthonomonadaceae bacterium]